MATLSPAQASLTSPSSPAHATISENSAEIRIERLFSIFVAAGYIGYAFVLEPTIAEQWELTAAWWSYGSLLLIFGPAAVLMVAALARRRRIMRWATRACAFGFIVAAVTWWPAWTGDPLPGRNAIWFSIIPGLAALAAAITMSTRATLAVMVVAVLAVQIARPPSSYYEHLLPAILFALAFIILYVGAALMAMRTGRLLDATQADAYADAAAAAEVDARRSQRSHIDALLHDWVISTLLAAARQGNTETVQQQALTTMDKLDSPPPEITTMSAASALTRLRAAVLAVDVTQPVSSSMSDDAADVRFPVEAIDVLDAAISEALRNSLLHAGDAATRTVAIAVTADAIDITIADDGVGFDIAAVPPHRLGLAVSILSRVRSLPGGWASATSTPGQGTTIELRWTVSS